MWSQVIPITFKEISEGTPDIEIHFVEGLHEQDWDPFDGPGGILAHALPPQPQLERTGK